MNNFYATPFKRLPFLRRIFRRRRNNFFDNACFPLSLAQPAVNAVFVLNVYIAELVVSIVNILDHREPYALSVSGNLREVPKQCVIAKNVWIFTQNMAKLWRIFG